jgi:hypothetical protein
MRPARARRPDIWLSIGLAATAALLLTGCVFARGSGNIVTEERDVSGFDKIEVRGSGELTVEQGSQEGVTITADDNLMRYITTKVSGDTLIIQVGPGNAPATILPTAPIKYTVRLEDLTGLKLSGSTEGQIDKLQTKDLQIEISGSGSVQIDDFEADSLSYTLSGSGSAKMTGTITEQDVTISGSGSYDAADLESKQATVNISGSGSTKLWVTDELDIKVSGSGSVVYYGNPHVNQNVSGSGSIEARGSK